MQLVSALIQEAGANGHPIPFGEGPWEVVSLTLRVLQTTGHSCGVWVLAAMAALVSGRHTTDLDESGIAWLCKTIFKHIVELPLYQITL